MSAESNIVSPASRQMSTSRVASATSLDPHELNSAPFPPNVPVPKVSTGTLKPELPSLRYSMAREHTRIAGLRELFYRTNFAGVSFQPRTALLGEPPRLFRALLNFG